MPPRTPSAGPEHAPCVSCGSPRVLNTQPRSHAQCMQAHAWCMPSGEVSLRTFASSLALCCSFCNAICSRYFSLSNASAYLPLPACGTGRDCAPPSLCTQAGIRCSLHFFPPSPTRGLGTAMRRHPRLRVGTTRWLATPCYLARPAATLHTQAARMPRARTWTPAAPRRARRCSRRRAGVAAASFAPAFATPLPRADGKHATCTRLAAPFARRGSAPRRSLLHIVRCSLSRRT